MEEEGLSVKRLISGLVVAVVCVSLFALSYTGARALSPDGKRLHLPDDVIILPMTTTRPNYPAEVLALLPGDAVVVDGKGYGDLYYVDGVELVWNGVAWVPSADFLPTDEEIEAGWAAADNQPIEPDKKP